VSKVKVLPDWEGEDWRELAPLQAGDGPAQTKRPCRREGRQGRGCEKPPPE